MNNTQSIISLYLAVLMFSGCSQPLDEAVSPNEALVRLDSTRYLIGAHTFQRASCGSCHSVQGILTGTRLKGALAKWDKDVLDMYQFVTLGHDGYIANNGKRAEMVRRIAIEAYGYKMPPSPFISYNDFKALLYYIEHYNQ